MEAESALVAEALDVRADVMLVVEKKFCSVVFGNGFCFRGLPKCCCDLLLYNV